MKIFGIELTIRNAKFKSGLDESRQKVNQFTESVRRSGAQVTALSRGFIALGAALGVGRFISQTVEYADSISDLSARFGVGAESLQKWGKLAEQNGASTESIAQAMNKLTIAREGALGGNDQLVKDFQKLGISIDDLRSKNVDELMVQIGKGTMNAADMVKVLGKGAVELRPTLDAAKNAFFGFSRGFFH